MYTYRGFNLGSKIINTSRRQIQAFGSQITKIFILVSDEYFKQPNKHNIFK